jgi:hypothetical protein
MDDSKLQVFRFTYRTVGQDISPGHMWGTREAIATLKGCSPLEATRRDVHRKLLDTSGFYYEETPTLFQPIEEPLRAVA